VYDDDLIIYPIPIQIPPPPPEVEMSEMNEIKISSTSTSTTSSVTMSMTSDDSSTLVDFCEAVDYEWKKLKPFLQFKYPNLFEKSKSNSPNTSIPLIVYDPLVMILFPLPYFLFLILVPIFLNHITIL